MLIYDIVFILTLPIYILPLYKLNSCFLGVRLYSKKTEISSYLLYAVCLVLIYNFIRVPIILLVFNIISFFLISLNYYASQLNRIVCSLSIYSLLFIIETIVWRATGYFKLAALENSEYNSIIGIILARVLMLIISYLIQKYKKSKTKNIPIPPYYYLTHILVLIGILYLFLVSLESDFLSITQIVISSVVVSVVNVMIIFIDEKIYDTILENNKSNILKQQNIAYENQTEIIDQSLSAIKSLKHDIKNHIHSLKVFHDNKEHTEFSQYVDRILEEIDGSKELSNSNNFIVDSILNFKLQELNSVDSDINLDIQIPSKLNILAYDITIILGNLIDNAITGINQAYVHKKLSICMHCTKGSLIILIDNSYNGNLNIEGEILKTTKQFSENHGKGLENVKKVVSTYNGEIQINYSKEFFSVAVLIPNID